MTKRNARPKKKMVVTRATKQDCCDYFGAKLETIPSIIAWAGKVEGKTLIIGGFWCMQGRWAAFVDMKNKSALRYRWELAYWARRSLQHAQKSGIRYIYADLDSTHPGASAWLQRLGFHLDPRTLYYFRWKAK